MRLTESYTVECCAQVVSFECKHEALEWLMKHIRAAHLNLLTKLEKRGRELARSQNGCGYYDGSDKDVGWPKAQETFREAWRTNALKEQLQRTPRKKVRGK